MAYCLENTLLFFVFRLKEMQEQLRVGSSRIQVLDSGAEESEIKLRRVNLDLSDTTHKLNEATQKLDDASQKLQKVKN